MKWAVLGCGNMVQSLFKEIKHESYAIDFLTYTPTKLKALKLAKKLNGEVLESLGELPECDLLLLGCKPQQLQSLITQLPRERLNKTIILSLLAGVQIERLQNEFDTKKVIRLMPNTPVSVGEGVLLWSFSSQALPHKDIILNIFASAGKHFDVSESELDLLTPFCGSGPAYLFEWIDHYCELLKAEGVPADQAKMIMGQTFLGASKLLLNSRFSPEDLRKQVTSQGGVTEAALKIFQKHDLKAMTAQAIEAAKIRNRELGAQS